MWPRGGGCVGTACAVALLLVAACGLNNHDVRVSALRDPSQVGRTYWLRPGGEGLEPGQLEYRRFEALVHKALAARGYQRVDARTQPHLVILLGYGVGPPQRQVSRKVGMVTHTKTTRTYQPPLGGLGVGSYRTSTKKSYLPIPIVEESTRYITWVTLSAVNGPAFVASQPAQEVWTTTAVIESEASDLQTLFPVMLATAMDYIGAHTGRELRIAVPLRSQRVQWLVGAR